MYGLYYTSSFPGNHHEYHVKYSNEQYLNIIQTLKVKTTLKTTLSVNSSIFDTFLLPYHILENDCLNQVNFILHKNDQTMYCSIALPYTVK